MPGIVNQYFDKVFVLSMKSDVNRRAKMEALLSAKEIEFEFFDATDGNDPQFDREWKLYDVRPLSTKAEILKTRKLIESRGAWGCLKSYIALFRHSLSKGFQRILIFEDDIILIRNFLTEFEAYMKRAPMDWKLLFLGASQVRWNTQKLKDGYYNPTPQYTYGAFAVGYDRSIMTDVLTTALKMITPFDKDPLSGIMEQHPKQCMVAFPNLVIADVSTSNIRDVRDMEQHAERMKWDLSLYELSE